MSQTTAVPLLGHTVMKKKNFFSLLFSSSIFINQWVFFCWIRGCRSYSHASLKSLMFLVIMAYMCGGRGFLGLLNLNLYDGVIRQFSSFTK